MQSDVEEIKRLTAQFEEGFNTNDIDRMMEFYADEYYDINMQSPRQSKQERTNYYQSIINENKYRIEVKVEEIIVSGDYAFARGDITLTGRENGSIRELRYVEIWKRNNSKWQSIWGIDADIR
jgi:ketosteroid isomerase-like protein